MLLSTLLNYTKTKKDREFMIAVIADDFTGAAEIGGIGLRHGLNVVIETNVEDAKWCDLLVIAADTRSMDAEHAACEIEKITYSLASLKPRFIFKKLDSVLRGNVAVELLSQMKAMNAERAIAIAGNPHFDRIIKDGVYYVKGVPLDKTFFSNDPEYPILSSFVSEIIGKGIFPVVNCKLGDKIPLSGLVFGDVTSTQELNEWSHEIENESVVAGGSGFFNVLIKKYYPVEKKSPVNGFHVGKRSLFVFGSMYPKSKNMIKQMNGSKMTIMNMPEGVYYSTEIDYEKITEWANEVVSKIKSDEKVIVLVDHEVRNEPSTSFIIKESIGYLVARVLDQVEVDDLLIEGGATTSVILKHMKITKLFPFKELDLGVIQMKSDLYPGMCITTKPGSYTWPDEIWINGKNKN
jgi:D-threonate/D-erythronate kinase